MSVVPVATEGSTEPCSLGCHLGIRCYSRATLLSVKCSCECPVLTSGVIVTFLRRQLSGIMFGSMGLL